MGRRRGNGKEEGEEGPATNPRAFSQFPFVYKRKILIGRELTTIYQKLP
jgi:hypothetical protein